jgi:hypothetical protein
MNWIKTIWNTLFKKELVSQNRINPVIVKAFADKLGNAIKFDKILNGKFAWAERYDDWAILQLLNLFIGLVGDKFKPSFWISIEQVLIYYADGNFQQASFILTKEVSPAINTFVAKGAQEIVLKNQFSLIFELTDYYMSNAENA